MASEEKKDTLEELLEELRQKPGYRDPRVKMLLDEEFPKLKALHQTGDEFELLRALGEIQTRVEEILVPAPPSDPPPPGPPPATEPSAGPPPAADAGGAEEPPEGPDPDVPALDDTVKESFNGMGNPEILQNLEAQYSQRLTTLQYFNIISDINNPVITDINNQQHRAPSFAEIQSKLLTLAFLEKTKRFKKPMLLVTPIGMSLKKLAEKVGGKRGRLDKHDPLNTSWDFDADKTGELVYFPKAYDKDNHGGVTKAELLAQNGGKNIFPGWQVTVVEGSDEIDLEVIKINPPPVDPNVSKYKNAHQFLQEMKEGGLDGLTPEEWLVLHAEGVRRGKPFESQYWTWLLAAYHKALGAVPRSYFDPDGAGAYVSHRHPEASNDYLGARLAARG